MYAADFGGIHLIGDFIDCDCDLKLLQTSNYIDERIKDLINKNNLTYLYHHSHQFYCENEISGYTMFALLAESHVSLHCWLELKKVQCDVFVCNYSDDNTLKAQNIFNTLMDIFQPQKPFIYTLSRR